MKRIITIAAVVIVLAAIVLLLIRNKKVLDSKKVVIDRLGVPVAVMLYSVAMLPLEEQLTAPATLYAHQEADITAAATGRVVSLNIELGSRVTKEQVVGRLDVRENELKLEATELTIEKLKRDYERNKVLVAGNATNKNAVEDSKFELESKVLEAEQLKKQISNSNIIAPIAGIITEKKMKIGEYANIGSSIASVVDVNSLKAIVYVPENNVLKLKVGQQANIITDVYPGEKYDGNITFISPKGDDNHNYLLEISIQNNKAVRLKAGLYARVIFNTSTDQQALQIPKIALVEGVKNPYVYVSESNKAIERKIVLGREVGENIEVKEGLNEGDDIITSGQINLVNGSNIRPIAKK